MGLQPTHEKGDPVKGITIDRFDGGNWSSRGRSGTR